MMKLQLRVCAWFLAFSFVSANASKIPSVLDDEPIPYKTAKEAAAAIKAMPNLIFSSNELWDNYSVPNSGTYWIVFRPDSQFYPAVVRRRLGMSLSGPVEKTTVLCNATADACNTLKSKLGLEGHK